MRFTLVQPPLFNRLDDLLTPPLGLLSLGAVLREDDADVTLVDLNLKGFQDPGSLDPETFYESAQRLIAATEPDVVGFTSMALESHVGLELARRLKQHDLRLRTLFGGPHFSSIAKPLLRHYPWVDFVAVGEAEQPLRDLLRHLRGRLNAGAMRGIAHRTAGEPAPGQPLSLPPALDELPLPAHDLVALDEYFAINRQRLMCIEHARGCQLRCSFCYSEAHWGHGERGKSTARIVRELAQLRDLGARGAFFVADNFLNSPARARALCAAIDKADLGLWWKCYGTLAQLDEPTLAALGRAGCRSVFIGVDAASDHNKKAFRKTYFKGWEPLRETLERCMRHGVLPTCSFMLSSDDTEDGIESTLRTALLTRRLGAEVTVNALAVYNGSALDAAVRDGDPEYSELKPRLLYDTPEINFENAFARERPELFPMHRRAPAGPATGDLHVFCHVARQLIMRNPLTLTRLALDTEDRVSGLVRDVARELRGPLASGIGLHSSNGYPAAARALFRLLSRHDTLTAVLLYELLDSRLPDRDLPTVRVLVENELMHRQLNRFHVVDLPYSPASIGATTRIDPDAPARPFLLTRFAGLVHHAPLSESCAPSILEELSAAVASHDPVTLARSTCLWLERQFVLLEGPVPAQCV